MYYHLAKNQAKSLNSKNLSLLKKVGDKTQFTTYYQIPLYSRKINNHKVNLKPTIDYCFKKDR